MTKINLFEFDEWVDLPLNDEELKEFWIYVDSVWQNRNLFNELEEKTELNNKQAFFNQKDRKIQAKNYVGYLKFREIEINIWPKIFRGEDDKSLIFNHLCFYLNYLPSFHFPFSIGEFGSTSTTQFWDMWLLAWLKYLETYLAEKKYHTWEDRNLESAYLKGKIEFEPYLKQSFAQAQWHKINSLYPENTFDNLFNRTLKYVIEIIPQYTDNQLIIDFSKKLLPYFKEVIYQRISYQNTTQLLWNDWQAEEKCLVKFCQLILLNEQINEQFDLYPNFTFLIPMERVFEEFIFYFLQNQLSNVNCFRQSMGFLAKEKDSQREALKIKNDIYIPDYQMIIDTKYKIIGDNSHQNFGNEMTDIYQILSYGIAKNCQNLLLIYPKPFGQIDEKNESIYLINSELIPDKEIQIKLVNLDITLANTADWLLKLTDKINKQILNALIMR
jgi:5-methylcytosine-specific restriction enzyme subunit McrC